MVRTLLRYVPIRLTIRLILVRKEAEAYTSVDWRNNKCVGVGVASKIILRRNIGAETSEDSAIL